MVEHKRRGRAQKRPRRGTRVQLSMTVMAEMKNLIDAAAIANKRSQGSIVERLVEKALLYDSMMKMAESTVELITKGHVERAFQLAGYRRQGDADVWVRDQGGHSTLKGDQASAA